MKASQYTKIAEHPLRQVFRNMVTDERDLPKRSEIRAAIDAAVPEGTDQRVKDALFTKAIELGQKARGAREDWFDLRGAADRLVLSVVEGWENADRVFPAEETEPVDVSGVLDGMDKWNPAERNIKAVERSLKADELAANLRRQS
jgi:hypothetical protein